ncbi:lipase family protein [Rhizobium ruizarguesonis]|uniref:alpha/beta hydrolase n=1 Tax=Rhizobium ruizarguesonis TaxID=2081791 RepID=UPI0010315864|nr:alpha/beta hydrolase [Rhizobium ruizarguesonis]TBA29360.1 alpha/beta hydrolase [Rhizobium ruizarguesonis]TBA30330.1 alpha/beta hydrolase [Rhizobium ruizarguesonis]
MLRTDIDIPAAGVFLRGQNSSALIVLLHAYNQTPTRMRQLAAAVRSWEPDWDILIPALPFSVFSLADPDSVAQDVIAKISAVEQLAHKRIILLGHSIGAVLARKIWVAAHGMATGSEHALPAQRWASKIDRIVQLAALNRGWVISSALNPWDRVRWTLGKMWGNFCRHALGRDPLIFGFHRGAPFLTSTRLECLELQRTLRERGPLVVQLIGTIDDMVAPTDNVDLATGTSFSYIEVDGVSHEGIADVSPASRDAIQLAICGTREEIAAVELDSADVYDIHTAEIDDFDLQKPPLANLRVKDVVFVIHGIRDRGFWTRRMAREIRTQASKRGHRCRTVTSTYGFFAMGPFLLPWIRRDKVQWLLDQYVTAKSLYPNASISYIGHSNGTYLLAKAMVLCPAIVINRAVFAGSVVRSDFPWQAYLGRQVMGVVNYVATSDWVVAIFPNGLQAMGQDLGGAGHNGFDDARIVNVRYVEGSHSAALAAACWDEMSKFIFDGVPTLPGSMLSQDSCVKRLGAYSPFICAFLALSIVGGILWILSHFSGPDLGWLMLFLVVVFAIKTAVTKL